MNKYPVYIISKGRWEAPLTARFFIEDGVDFKIAVEPQEYENYCDSLGEKYIIKLPFSNLGVGSYPARNHCWEDSIKNGSSWHWLFDDNIRHIKRIDRGKRVNCDSLKALAIVEQFTERYSNIGISGFNYEMFVTPSVTKPFYLNTHVYSAMLIRNSMPFRWRMKYNEDVDLCLQVLDKKLCTVLFNALFVYKTSTTVKMKGGNQSELYCDNSHDKKILKARSIEEVWPQYAKTVWRFNRPHHSVDWKKHFKHKLIRSIDVDFDSFAEIDNHGLELKKNDN